MSEKVYDDVVKDTAAMAVVKQGLSAKCYVDSSQRVNRFVQHIDDIMDHWTGKQEAAARKGVLRTVHGH